MYQELSRCKKELTAATGIFAYSLDNHTLINITGGNENYRQKTAVDAYFSELFQSYDPHHVSNGWTSFDINNEFYLMRTLRFQNTLVGVWSNTQKLTGQLYDADLASDNKFFLADNQGTILTGSLETDIKRISLDDNLTPSYLTISGNKYMVIGSPSEKGNVSLITLVRDTDILQNLNSFRIIIVVLSVFIGSFLVAYSVYLRKIIMKPMKRVVIGMDELRRGNFDIELLPKASSNEFQSLNQMFNLLVTEIKKLKISVYEEKLSKQKTRLQFLQVQSKSHFFVNTLNVVYNFAELKDYASIQKMVCLLSKYYQYTLYGQTDTKLSIEIERVQNYCEIQEMRFGQKILLNLDVPDWSLDVSIPQLIILTFVENSCKYALCVDRDLTIDINISSETISGEKYLVFSISDNGNGFSPDALEAIHAKKQFIDKRGKHIGIYNLQSRLEIIFKGKAGFNVFNGNNGGASAIVSIPYYPE